ncbi:hypothetical protein [Clostridium guangxiense]|uniref:hypothetical protein n=1 Tax=Clostridium guangxiense TaxID=1662055 RepID=UPI001E4FCEE0|nr:hypothetical protein [Clostridium guangxiense]MCD2347191.1 hypothetical protein [Clostridium guangxiense]
MSNEKRYLNMLLEQFKAENRKSINLNFDEKLLGGIDEVLENISINTKQFCSRNSFMEVAAREYLLKLKDEIDRLNFIKSNSNQSDQIIIFTSADHLGKYAQYYQNDYWKAVYLGKDVVDLIRKGYIKYFALYKSKVYKSKCGGGQHIIEYSEIKSINYITSGPDKGKYEFFLKNRKQLPKPITKGSVNPVSLMRGRRTTLQKFLAASTIDNL